MKRFIRFFKDEEGVTAIEYGLLAALIAIAIAAGAGALGTNLNTFFQDIADYLAGVVVPAPINPGP